MIDTKLFLLIKLVSFVISFNRCFFFVNICIYIYIYVYISVNTYMNAINRYLSFIFSMLAYKYPRYKWLNILLMDWMNIPIRTIISIHIHSKFLHTFST